MLLFNLRRDGREGEEGGRGDLQLPVSVAALLFPSYFFSPSPSLSTSSDGRPSVRLSVRPLLSAEVDEVRDGASRGENSQREKLSEDFEPSGQNVVPGAAAQIFFFLSTIVRFSPLSFNFFEETAS